MGAHGLPCRQYSNAGVNMEEEGGAGHWHRRRNHCRIDGGNDATTNQEGDDSTALRIKCASCKMRPVDANE